MRVAIVGGGISGLALAERLAAAGVEPLVLEAEDRVGGKIATREKDGFLLETGPNGFLDQAPATRELVERLGTPLLPAEPVAQKRWVHLRGKLREVPGRPGALLRSDILPAGAKARLALEPLLATRARADDESIADFGRRHLGARATRDLLSAMVVGIFAGDAETLSLPACFPRMAALEREHRSLVLAMKRLRAGGPAPTGRLTSAEGGLGALVGALRERLGDAVRRGVRVERIERRGAGVRLLTDGAAGQQEIEADAVAITAPADVAAMLLGPFDARVAELAAEVPYAPMAVVHLAWPKERIAHPLDGFGFLNPPHEGRPILGALFVSSIFPWRAPPGQALFTVMIGGAVSPERVRLSESELVGLAVAELSGIVGAHGSPTLAEVVRWERAIPQYEVGHLARRREIDGRMASVERIHLGGNAWSGVGINDCIAAAGPLAERIVGGGGG